MYDRIAVNLGCRGLQDSSPDTLRQAEHVDHAHHICLDRFYGIVLIMDRRSGAGEIIDLIDLEQYRFGYIVAYQFKSRMVHQVRDVLLTASKKIVKADDLMPIFYKPLAKMRTDKPGSAGD